MQKGSVLGRCLSILKTRARLLHRHADFGFMHRLIEVLNRLRPMASKIVLGNIEFVLGSAHVFQSFVDVRMPFRRGNRGRCRNSCDYSCWGWLWSGCRRGKGERQKKCRYHEQS